MNCIKQVISKNNSNKIYFNDDYSFLINENDYFHYEDKFGN